MTYPLFSWCAVIILTFLFCILTPSLQINARDSYRSFTQRMTLERKCLNMERSL